MHISDSVSGVVGADAVDSSSEKIRTVGDVHPMRLYYDFTQWMCSLGPGPLRTIHSARMLALVPTLQLVLKTALLMLIENSLGNANSQVDADGDGYPDYMLPQVQVMAGAFCGLAAIVQ